MKSSNSTADVKSTAEPRSIVESKPTTSSSVVSASADKNIEHVPADKAPPQKVQTMETDGFDAPTQGDEGNWEDDSFFNLKSPFRDQDNKKGKDAFGFPETDATSPTDAFDAWGEPSSMLPASKFNNNRHANHDEIDYFSPRDADGRFGGKKDPFDNSDATSYDGTEMSEVTNPTFASSSMFNRPDPDSDDGKNYAKKGRSGGTVASSTSAGTSTNNRAPSQGSPSNEPSESAIPLMADSDFSKKSVSSSDSIGGTEGQSTNSFPKNPFNTSEVTPEDEFDDDDDLFHEKENYSSENDADNLTTLSQGNKMQSKAVINPFNADDPPLASLETLESSEDEKDVNGQSKATDDNNSYSNDAAAVKSRILSKYSKSGKTRKTIRVDNRSNISHVSEQDAKGNQEVDPVFKQTMTPESKVVAKPALKYDKTPAATPVRTNVSSKAIQSSPTGTQARNAPSNTNYGTQPASAGRYRRRPDLMVQQPAPTSAASVAVSKPISTDTTRQTMNASPTLQRSRRRGGRSSPRRDTASGTLSPDNQTVRSMGSNKGKYSYSMRKKNTPSFIDDPNYYSVNIFILVFCDTCL